MLSDGKQSGRTFKAAPMTRSGFMIVLFKQDRSAFAAAWLGRLWGGMSPAVTLQTDQVLQQSSATATCLFIIYIHTHLDLDPTVTRPEDVGGLDCADMRVIDFFFFLSRRL